jgi:predicted transcriptional regulator
MCVASAGKRDFLLSIRPNYADKIVSGAKTVELRRRFADEAEAGAILLIYSTSPTQAIIGSARIKEVKRLGLSTLWRQYGKAACILRQDFDTYFEGLDKGYAILLEEVKPFRRAVTASDLREKFGFVAPQSFMYLRHEYYCLLKNERI